MEKSLVDVRQNFSKYIRELKNPILIVNHKRPVAVLAPLVEEEELYHLVIKGKVHPDIYMRRLFGVGIQNLNDGSVIIRPTDIVEAHNSFE